MIRFFLLIFSTAFLMAACGSDMQTVAAPAGLHYTTLNASYAANQPVVPNTPASSGGPIALYAVTPALPPGLTLDATSGIISGTPAQPTARAIYTITGSNKGGSATTAITITVTSGETAPANLSYDATPVSYELGEAITPNLPHSEGGAITAWSVTPELPPGLQLDAATGVISGTPSIVTTSTTYTVSGSNGAGSVSTALVIAVALPVPPASLAYAQSWVLGGEGRVLLTNSAQSSGGAIRRFSVTPALPAGLSLNTRSGEISGTPTETVSRTMYTVTGANAAGSVSAPVSLEVVKPGTWAQGNPMNEARVSHSATLLADGKVLVAGGDLYGTWGQVRSSAEIYDPAHGTWTETAGPMNVPRAMHDAMRLKTGPHADAVLAIGGIATQLQSKQSDRYDPLSGTWTWSTSLMSEMHVNNQTTTELDDGTILVVGGSLPPPKIFGPAGLVTERYDPVSDTWAAAGTMQSAHVSHTATLLHDGTVLVAGGQQTITNSSTTERYNPQTGMWNTTGELVEPRSVHSATLLPDGKVLVAGGTNLAGVTLNSAELYDPDTGMWSAIKPMNVMHRDHVALLLPNAQVLVAGGDTLRTDRTTELYDIKTGEWTMAGLTHTNRFGATFTLLPNGQVLAAGRISDSGDTDGATTELFVP
ncbi:kelch repeat-containing protein [Paraburkholderia bonniea]|uniref:kelch repeat-containing protein n=1 Tax=Paraburkholderia bonniea TaxID=2152891 RepID=UPI0025735C59|nr:kelch repeat-containing protein [Paraburkholderia bonniea]WJF90054.1 kelch repeat-containing protein [Paraburkholderia bonniea]WJF93368.1 kelch repeat-containing protein [Paraburkholderia bonniea]